MLVESIGAVQERQSMNTATHSNEKRNRFVDLFQSYLNNNHRSPSQKIEVTGVLIPFDGIAADRAYKFKLDTDSKEYILCMNQALERIAKTIEWEEVTIKGRFDFHTNVLDVEKMSLSKTRESTKVTLSSEDAYFDIEYYLNTIAQHGKLEPPVDFSTS